MSFRHLGQYKGNFYIADEVLIANLSPAKAPVTPMHFKLFHFHILAFSNIVTGPKTPVTGIRFHGFTSCLHGNDENDHEKATYLNMQSKAD